MKKLFKNNKEIFWFLGFVASAFIYLSVKLLETSPNPVHTSLDDKIPFLPIFIIPYVIWYIYVPAVIFLTYLKDKKYFVRQIIIFYLGMLLSYIFFAIYPTVIEFRPTAEGDGFLLWLCRLVYANDVPPVNALPSLHCYEALMAHIITFVSGPYKKKIPLRITSAVLTLLICASTVFVKQHSILDVIFGCGLAVLIYIIEKIINKGLGERYGKNI